MDDLGFDPRAMQEWLGRLQLERAELFDGPVVERMLRRAVAIADGAGY